MLAIVDTRNATASFAPRLSDLRSFAAKSLQACDGPGFWDDEHTDEDLDAWLTSRVWEPVNALLAAPVHSLADARAVLWAILHKIEIAGDLPAESAALARVLAFLDSPQAVTQLD